MDELPGALPPPGAMQIAVFLTFSVILALWTRAELAHRAIAAERGATDGASPSSSSRSADKDLKGGDGVAVMAERDSALSRRERWS